MATIEQRAKCYSHRNGTEFLTGYENAERDAYIQGATEQRAIDIDRAWQWMREHIHLIGSEMELHSQFLKAMKKQ